MPFLLRLPREIRDQILSYVLYEADGLAYKESKDGLARLCRRAATPSNCGALVALIRKGLFLRAFTRCRMHRSEINQVKYVCKQLYRETKGMVLPQNRVVLEDSRSLNSMDRCLSLFQDRSMLRRVAIKCSSKAFESDHGKSKLLAIMQYCIDNTHVSVRIHIPYWFQADFNFVPRGLSSTLR